MNKNVDLMHNCALFSQISPDEIDMLLGCLQAREKFVARGSFVFHAGDYVKSVYLNLSGNLHVINEDVWGNRVIIESIQPFTLFGEAYSVIKRDTHIISVIAAEDSVVLEFDPKLLFESCARECRCHTTLIRNCMYILSEKLVILMQKLGHIVQRTLRSKVLSYLNQCARQAGSNSFDIFYTRQQLADYLCVDRSALSHELSRLRDEGLLRYHKNHIELLYDYHKPSLK